MEGDARPEHLDHRVGIGDWIFELARLTFDLRQFSRWVAFLIAIDLPSSSPRRSNHAHATTAGPRSRLPQAEAWGLAWYGPCLGLRSSRSVSLYPRKSDFSTETKSLEGVKVDAPRPELLNRHRHRLHRPRRSRRSHRPTRRCRRCRRSHHPVAVAVAVEAVAVEVEVAAEEAAEAAHPPLNRAALIPFLPKLPQPQLEIEAG